MAKPFTELRKMFFAVLDQHADIIALTGRPQGNVMSFKYFDNTAIPGLFHQMIVATPRVTDGGYEVQCQLTAVAETMESAEELLSTAVSLMTPTNLEALGYDAAIIQETPRDLGDVDFGRAVDETDNTERADIDLLFWITI